MLNKRALNFVALVLLMAVAVIYYLVISLSVTTRRLQARSVDTSIVRLHDEDGRFFCSGVVISKTRLVTAAHCVIRDFGFFSAPVEFIEVRTQSGKRTGTMAKIEGANPRQDLAVLKGDFSGYDSRLVITNTTELNNIFLSWNSKLVACGFPDAGPLACSKLVKIDRALFFFSARGFLYPGMSGGPVIDVKTGAVVAVNQAVTMDGRIIVSPLIELFDQLGLNESSDK